MEAVFLKLFNMSITASWLVLVVIILRVVLKNAPKSFRIVLWALVGFRLICPISLESAYSLIPSTETIPTSNLISETTKINTGIDIIDDSVNEIMAGKLTSTIENSRNPISMILTIGAVIWMIGMIVLLAYTLLSCYQIHKKVQEAVPLQENIFLCDCISSPFLFGMIRPRIYLPSNMKEEHRVHVIAHEQAHLERYDHWWKSFGFLLLVIYWFNPIIWIAYVLFCKDLELACDEKVLFHEGSYIKKSYSDALIECSVSKRTMTACPLAFGEVGIKERIQSVLNYKKPTAWAAGGTLLVGVIVAICFLTNPSSDYRILTASSGSECDEITFRYDGGYWGRKSSFVEVEWTNHSDSTVIYGESFSLYKDGKAVSVKQYYAVNDIGYVISPGETITLRYSFGSYNINFSESGIYRIEQKFNIQGDGSYLAYVEFEVGEK